MSKDYTNQITVDKSPVLTAISTLMGNSEAPINLHAFGLLEEAGVQRENPHRRDSICLRGLYNP